MLKAGTCICPNCGTLSSEGFYKSGRVQTRVKLHRKNLTGEYYLEPICEGDQHHTAALKARISADAKGLPDRIYVSVDGGEQIPMRRACPECEEYFFPGYGTLPTAVVGMVGSPGSGKSCFLKAVSNLASILAVNSAGYPYRMNFSVAHNRTGRSAATAEDSLGESNYLVIEDGKDRAVAAVLLLDVAGEHYGRASDDASVWRVLLPQGGYDGCDAIVFIDYADDSGSADQTDHFDAVSVFNRCQEYGFISRIPVAYVRTHLDELIHKGYTVTAEDGSQIPLLTKDTFLHGNTYAPREVVRRIMLQDSISRQLPETVLSVLSQKHACGFLVQSCAPMMTGEEDPFEECDETIEDYSQMSNVADPLLWLLNRLGLWPFGQKEEGNG